MYQNLIFGPFTRPSSFFGHTKNFNKFSFIFKVLQRQAKCGFIGGNLSYYISELAEVHGNRTHPGRF